jgi:hypothetical protein
MAPEELAGDEGRDMRDEATLTAPEKTDITPLASGTGNASGAGSGSGSGGGGGQDEAEVEAPKKPGIMARLGLDVPTLGLMFK